MQTYIGTQTNLSLTYFKIQKPFNPQGKRESLVYNIYLLELFWNAICRGTVYRSRELAPPAGTATAAAAASCGVASLTRADGQGRPAGTDAAVAEHAPLDASAVLCRY